MRNSTGIAGHTMLVQAAKAAAAATSNFEASQDPVFAAIERVAEARAEIATASRPVRELEETLEENNRHARLEIGRGFSLENGEVYSVYVWVLKNVFGCR
jgi:hypothetical protein